MLTGMSPMLNTYFAEQKGEKNSGEQPIICTARIKNSTCNMLCFGIFYI